MRRIPGPEHRVADGDHVGCVRYPTVLRDQRAGEEHRSDRCRPAERPHCHEPV